MFKPYWIFMRVFGFSNLSTGIAEEISMYYQSSVPSDSIGGINWYIGLTNNANFNKGTHCKLFHCDNHIEAKDTKAYFTNRKHMQDETPVPKGGETIIYVHQ